MSWPTTPLIVAAKMGHADMVSLLMERGATIAGVSKVSCIQRQVDMGRSGSDQVCFRVLNLQQDCTSSGSMQQLLP